MVITAEHMLSSGYMMTDDVDDTSWMMFYNYPR